MRGIHMITGDYTIEATRAIVEERLREANHARWVNQFHGRAAVLIGALITLILGH